MVTLAFVLAVKFHSDMKNRAQLITEKDIVNPNHVIESLNNFIVSKSSK
jgi:hypothetical protein